MWLGKGEEGEDDEAGTSPTPVYIGAGCQETSSQYGAAGHLSKGAWTKRQRVPHLGGSEVLLSSRT